MLPEDLRSLARIPSHEPEAVRERERMLAGWTLQPPVARECCTPTTTNPRLTCSTSPVADTLARVAPPASSVGLDGVDVSVSVSSRSDMPFARELDLVRIWCPLVRILRRRHSASESFHSTSCHGTQNVLR
jgi:hypothetical protein